MRDRDSHDKRSANPNVLEVPFDPERTPREQIQVAIASVKPISCEAHPHETLQVDTAATIHSVLHHEYPYCEERRCTEFVAIYERCAGCLHTSLGPGIEIPKCPCDNGYRHRGIVDDKGIPLPCFRANKPLELDLSVRAQFEQWLSEGLRCDDSNQPLRRCQAEFIPPFKAWRIELQFASCPQCGLERLGISPDESYASFEDFDLEPAEINNHWETCRKFAANPGGVLLLLGNCGTGKTHLSIACLRERLKSGDADLKFVKHRHFVTKHRLSLRAVPFGEDAPESPLLSCRRAGFLVYDELTAPTDRYAYEDLLLDLFENRIGQFKPSIITANLSRNELESALGTRLFDRLRRVAFAVLEFGFESRRPVYNAEYLQRKRSSV